MHAVATLALPRNPRPAGDTHCSAQSNRGRLFDASGAARRKAMMNKRVGRYVALTAVVLAGAFSLAPRDAHAYYNGIGACTAGATATSLNPLTLQVQGSTSYALPPSVNAVFTPPVATTQVAGTGLTARIGSTVTTTVGLTPTAGVVALTPTTSVVVTPTVSPYYSQEYG